MRELQTRTSLSISKCQCCPHIETSQLICTENQLTGFYMRKTLALNGLKWEKLVDSKLQLYQRYRQPFEWLLTEKDTPWKNYAERILL